GGDGRRCRAAARGRVARVRCHRPRPRRHAARIGCPRVDGAVPPRHGSRPALPRLHRAPPPALRAYGSTALAYTALLVVQVGLFAAVFVGTIAERYLLTVLPLLAVGLCTWISRGAPRALPVVLPLCVLVVVGAAAVRIAQLATPETLPNAPTAAGLMRLGSEGWARAALVIAALVAGALVLALPRRFAWVTAAVVGVGLALLSVDAGDRIAAASAHE